MADRGVIVRPSWAWYLFNWLLNSSARKDARQLQRETIARQAEHEAYLRQQDFISQERLIEKRAREGERLLMIKIRSENPELYNVLLAENQQRRQFEEQRTKDAEAAAAARLEEHRKVRRRENRVLLIVSSPILAVIAFMIYASLSSPIAENTSSSAVVPEAASNEAAPTPETLSSPAMSPSPAAAGEDGALYQLTRDADVVTEPGSTTILRTVHAEHFIHVIEIEDAAGTWLRIRMHDGSEGYIPQDAAEYVSDWDGSVQAKTSP